MELFRRVADAGKTVVCVTHGLANVEATCHLVAILAQGGRLAYFGPPASALAYFGVKRLGDVYLKLGERPAAEWAARFRVDPDYHRLVTDQMPLGTVVEAEGPRARIGAKTGLARDVRQGWVLARRYAAVWRSDRAALFVLVAQALLVALLLGLVFGDLGDEAIPASRAARTANLLLLLAVSCFWFGCNTSAKELVKDRKIFARERAFNLRIPPYHLSKSMLLMAVGLTQATLLFGIVRPWCRPEGPILAQWAVLAALTAAGTAFGLLISAVARTEGSATGLVPIVIIPQIILGGVISPLKGLASLLGDLFITVRWGQQALEDLGLKASSDVERGSWGGSLAIIATQTLAVSLVTVLVLRGDWPRKRPS